MDTNQSMNHTLGENATSTVAMFTADDVDKNIQISKTVLKTIFGIISVVGIGGNLLVILVVVRVKRLRTLTGYFILNQSCIDLLGSILLAALYCFPSIKMRGGMGSNVLCKMWVSTYPLWACFNASTLNLAFLTFERYMGVVHPVLHHNRFTRTQAKALMVVAWTVPFCWLGYWAGVNTVIDGNCYPAWPNAAAQRAIGVMAFLVSYLIPLFMMTFTYLKIFLVLRKQAKLCHTGARSLGSGQATISSSSSHTEGASSRAKRNVIKTLAIVFVTYVICWSPNQIEYFRFNMGVHMNLSSVWFEVTIIMAFCNVCVNPMIYTLKYQEFRDGLKRLFCKTNKIANQQLQIGVQDPINTPAVPTGDTGV